MTPLEAVEGATVTKVAVTTYGDRVKTAFRVTILLPDGTEIRISTWMPSYEKKVAKTAGLKMISKAARKAAVELRMKVEQAVRVKAAEPGTQEEVRKAVERAARRASGREERKKEERRQRIRESIAESIRTLDISLEELTQIWKSCVVKTVMDS